VDAKISNGQTPLIIAAATGHVQVNALSAK
jgi:ankyrin repeat protein